MQEKSVIARTVEAAGGVYAPGHLGELTQVVDFVLVDAALEETGTREKRLRLLPSRVVVYFVLAPALFEDCSYRGVWGKLTAALEGLRLVSGGLLAVQSPTANRSGTAAAAVRDPRRARRPPRAGRLVLSRAADRGHGRGRHLAARAR